MISNKIRKVLVVDDEPAICLLISAMVEEIGLQAAVAVNGDDAIQKLAADSEIGLVLLDLRMPIMNGEGTFQAIRNMWPKIKVIIVSGLNPAESGIGAIEPGPDAFVSKPFNFADLANAIEAVAA